MKTVGIIGGMSWESTSTYYRRLNQLINEQLSHAVLKIIQSYIGSICMPHKMIEHADQKTSYVIDGIKQDYKRCVMPFNTALISIKI